MAQLYRQTRIIYIGFISLGAAANKQADGSCDVMIFEALVMK